MRWRGGVESVGRGGLGYGLIRVRVEVGVGGSGWLDVVEIRREESAVWVRSGF